MAWIVNRLDSARRRGPSARPLNRALNKIAHWMAFGDAVGRLDSWNGGKFGTGCFSIFPISSAGVYAGGGDGFSVRGGDVVFGADVCVLRVGVAVASHSD